MKCKVTSTDKYTIKKITGKQLDKVHSRYIYEASVKLNAAHGSPFFFHAFPVKRFADEQHLWICYRDKVIVGFLAATMTSNLFDPSIKQLKQTLLYADPGTRASKYLLENMIDFGRLHANHIHCVIGQKTNIKPRSLERLGFKELETTFRMEIEK